MISGAVGCAAVAAMLDALAALKWVHRHIGAFGGAP
eukprot:SAG11_NODE_7851_length_1088_cov_1.146613_1_plen_35_part_10